VQAQCPQCSARIQIDDTKVPDRSFKVRCPKCQAVMTLPGRGAEAPPWPRRCWRRAQGPVGPGPAAAPPSAYELPPPPSPAAIARRERAEAGENDALVALSGPVAASLQQALAHLGFNVDVVDDAEEGARLLEQGVYEVAVTARAVPVPGKPETLAQRMLRLPLEARRRVFVVLVGRSSVPATGPRRGPRRPTSS